MSPGGSAQRVVIAGVGHAAPAAVRLNDDPVFDWIRSHNPSGVDLFKGYHSRRVLAPGEDLIDILVPAARKAMDDAGIGPDEIDMLTGFASLDPVYAPNPLALLHQKLGLRPGVWILPIANDYANFVAGLSVATAAVETGRAEHVLVACGSNWTRHVDYHSAQCVAAGDGAGAAVVGRLDGPAGFSLLDTETISETEFYGTMFMAGDGRTGVPDPTGPDIPGFEGVSLSWPYFHITERGRDAFRSFGEARPVEAVNRLLARNGVSPAQVTLIAHQASTVLTQYWQEHINPRRLLDTLAEFGDMPDSNQAVTLAARYADVRTDYLVLSTLGIEFSTTAMLLGRG